MSSWRPPGYINKPAACKHQVWIPDCFTLVGLRFFCMQCGLEVDVPSDRLEKLAGEVAREQSS